MSEEFQVPEEPIELTEDERADIEADLTDLAQMHSIFSPQNVKGVVIACQECRQNHFYEWALLQDNLQHMLDTGEPRMHEPAWDIDETEYIQWDYGKGFVDALVDNGIEPGRAGRADRRAPTARRRSRRPSGSARRAAGSSA